jgi:hypothetical protein
MFVIRPDCSRTPHIRHHPDIKQFHYIALQPQPLDDVAIAQIDDQKPTPYYGDSALNWTWRATAHGKLHQIIRFNAELSALSP